ncbi:hypothetical protein MMC13_003735 [Lambiella insularis]|nr:hypothetical protein [Lambiella insularis]
MFARQSLIPQRGSIAMTASIAAAGIGGTYCLYAFFTSSKSAAGTPLTFGRSPSFVSLCLESSEVVNHNTKRLRFVLPESNACTGLSLTSSLLTLSRPQGHFIPVIRPYTPISELDKPGYIELLVKHYPNGKASSYLHSMTPGESLFFITALKGYQWTPNKYPHITLLAGGAGITPIYQLIQGILNNPQDKTAITLVFGVNSDADLLLKDKFSDYERKFPTRFRAHYVFSNPIEGSPLPKGYISKDFLQKLNVKPEGNDTRVFLCGPPAMEASLLGTKSWRDSSKSGILEELGYTKDQIHQF